MAAADRLTPYQRFVVFAAWVGLGFDLMDSILFNFVAPIAVPDLLGIAPGAPGAKAQTAFWTGVLTSVMLFGWATGGVLFGRFSDRIGRTRTVVWTRRIGARRFAARDLAHDGARDRVTIGGRASACLGFSSMRLPSLPRCAPIGVLP
jgi:MFS family permease